MAMKTTFWVCAARKPLARGLARTSIQPGQIGRPHDQAWEDDAADERAVEVNAPR
jgi:hypothetical protein